MDTDALERLSRLLQQLRGERSIADFARQIGKPTSTVHNWLKGKTTPDYESLELLSEIQGWSLDALLEYLRTGIGPIELESSEEDFGRGFAQGAVKRRDTGKPSPALPLIQPYVDCYCQLVDEFRAQSLPDEYRPTRDNLIQMAVAAANYSQSIGPYKYAALVKAG